MLHALRTPHHAPRTTAQGPGRQFQ